MSARADGEIDRLIGARYRVIREIGRGASAIVYAARDAVYHREVALKLLRRELVASPLAERFEREINIARRLHHDAILPVLDVGEDAERPFYTMTLVSGGSLRARLDRERQLPVDEAVAIARRLAAALDYATAEGVLHRDVKPENVLLADDRSWLADFGVGRSLLALSGDRITSAGVAVGTPMYMSPEQAAGQQHIDGRSDQYALALVLWEMLTGVPPFRGATEQAIIAQRMLHAPEDVRVLRPFIPSHVADALARALQREPADRFPTCTAFADALADVPRLPTSSIEAPASTTSSNVRARPRWRFGIWSALLTLSVVVLVRFFWPLSGTLAAAAAIDDASFVALPFAEGDTTLSLGGVDVALLVQDQLRHWEGVRTIEDLRVRDAVARARHGAMSREQTIAVARRLGVRYAVWGDVRRVGAQVRVYATLVDVTDGREVATHTTSVPASLDGLQSSIDALTDSLVVQVVPNVSRSGLAPVPVRSLPAWREYARGRAALDSFDLVRAIDALDRAVTLQPDYGDAHFWLALALEWRIAAGNDDAESIARWRRAAENAVRNASSLAPGTLPVARGMASLAAGDPLAACRQFDALIRSDSSSFLGWWGRGECLSSDHAVVPDRRSPSGARFRSEQNAAIDAYEHAFAIVPSAYRVFRGEATRRLKAMFFTTPSTAIAGFTADSAFYFAIPEVVADTIAFVPYRVTDPRVVESEARARRHDAALMRNRLRLATLALQWTRDFADDPFVLEISGLAAEAAATDGAMLRATALQPLRRARRSLGTANSEDAERIDVATIRVLLRLGEWNAARMLADSVLRVLPSDVTRAERLAPVAALVGREDVVARLLVTSGKSATAADRSAGRVVTVDAGVATLVARATAAAVLGAPPERQNASLGAALEAIRRAFPPTRAASVASALLFDAARASFGLSAARPIIAGYTGDDPVMRAQRALIARDSALAERIADSTAGAWSAIPPWRITLASRLDLVRLLRTLGGAKRTGVARALVASAIDSVATWPVDPLLRVPEAAAFARLREARIEMPLPSQP